MNEDQDLSETVKGMKDAELIEIWRNASEEETENLSPFLEAIVEEMGRRNLSL